METFHWLEISFKPTNDGIIEFVWNKKKERMMEMEKLKNCDHKHSTLIITYKNITRKRMNRVRQNERRIIKPESIRISINHSAYCLIVVKSIFIFATLFVVFRGASSKVINIISFKLYFIIEWCTLCACVCVRVETTHTHTRIIMNICWK